MNENDFDRTARAWLEDGPTRMSDRAVLSALEEIHTTRQRRAWWPARRASPVNIYARAAIAAVLVVGVGLVAINVLPRGSDGSGVGGEPTASPSASPAPIASPAAAVPDLTGTFVSTFNGFSIGHPEDATIEPATEPWDPRVVDQGYANYDLVHTDTFGSVGGSSTAIPDGVSIDEWIDQELGHDQPGCAVPRSEMPQIIIDGQPGRVWEGCPGEVAATVVVDGRLYFFSLFVDTGVSRAVFDAYASTIDLRPEEAASPAP